MSMIKWSNPIEISFSQSVCAVADAGGYTGSDSKGILCAFVGSFGESGRWPWQIGAWFCHCPSEAMAWFEGQIHTSIHQKRDQESEEWKQGGCSIAIWVESGNAGAARCYWLEGIRVVQADRCINSENQGYGVRHEYVGYLLRERGEQVHNLDQICSIRRSNEWRSEVFEWRHEFSDDDSKDLIGMSIMCLDSHDEAKTPMPMSIVNHQSVVNKVNNEQWIYSNKWNMITGNWYLVSKNHESSESLTIGSLTIDIDGCVTCWFWVWFGLVNFNVAWCLVIQSDIESLINDSMIICCKIPTCWLI